MLMSKRDFYIRYVNKVDNSGSEFFVGRSVQINESDRGLKSVCDACCPAYQICGMVSMRMEREVSWTIDLHLTFCPPCKMPNIHFVFFYLSCIQIKALVSKHTSQN